MEQKYTYLTISEMAKFTGIPAKTLRYYDEIGLFSPAFRMEGSDYRCYLRTQLDQAILLQSLKALGMSLKDIKQEFNNMSALRYAELLRLRADAIRQEIQTLQRKELDLQAWIEDVDEAIEAPLDQCFIRRYPEMKGYIFHRRTENRAQHELAMRDMEQLYGNGAHLGRARRIIPREGLETGNFLVYSGFFIPDTSVTGTQEPMVTIPEQAYAVIFISESHENCGPYWEKLLRFIRQEGYEVAGDAYRTIPVEMGISRLRSDYVARLIIPIRRPV